MGRVLGIALFALAVWVGLEFYQHGVDGAFGGLLSGRLEAPAQRSTPDRATDAFQRAYNKSETRVEQLLDQPGMEE
jgi:hypothetical protein